MNDITITTGITTIITGTAASQSIGVAGAGRTATFVSPYLSRLS